MVLTRLASTLSAAALISLTEAPTMSDSTADARARFASPGNAHRMLKIVHGWPDGEPSIRALLDSISAQGYGGVVTNANFDGGYTESDKNWERLTVAASELRRRKMPAWLYDELGYPSGRAGDLVLKGHPELEVRGLMIVHRQVSGGRAEMEAPPGDILLAEAYPVVRGDIALGRRVRLKLDGRRLTWDAPAGTWHVVLISVDRLFDGTQIACSGYPERSPYVGLMEPGLTPRFMSFTHDRYAGRLGADLARTFAATFTDEPSTMAIFFNKIPWATLPWCSDFAAQFRKRRGYDLLPNLACLVAEASNHGRKVRSDFYRTVSDLMVERWWEPLRKWSTVHRVPSGGHLLLEENILHHVPLYGNAFEAFRHMDSTGIDCLSSDPTVPRYTSMAGMGADIPWNAARLASSAAEIDGKPLVMCEVSEHIQNAGNAARNLTDAHYRGTWARLILGGINVLTSYHSFPGWSVERIRAANDWIGRCLAATSGGRRAAQVAVVYPTETVWGRFTPSDLWVEQAAPECRQVEQTLRDLSEALFRGCREFDYIDGHVLAEGSVQDGMFAYRDHRWRAVVLPECDTLPEAAWRNLAALKRAGGSVVVVGARPRNCLDHFPCKVAASAARSLAAGSHKAIIAPASEGGSVPALLARVLPADLKVEASSPIRMTRRSIGDSDVWFLMNDSLSEWVGRVEAPASGAVEVWDPVDGSTQKHPSGSLDLQLKPYDVRIVRGRAATP